MCTAISGETNTYVLPTHLTSHAREQYTPGMLAHWLLLDALAFCDADDEVAPGCSVAAAGEGALRGCVA